MEFKKLANNALNFAIYRVIEIAGIFLVISGFMLLVSLAASLRVSHLVLYKEGAKLQGKRSTRADAE